MHRVRPSRPDRRAVLGTVAVFAVVLLLPSVVGASSLLVISRVVVFAIAVVGFNLLYFAGQLSLAHPFFMAAGGFAYVVASSEGGREQIGLGVAPVVALIFAVLVTGVLGLAFSPISSRVEGLSLAAASLALVFIGEYAFPRAAALTGGPGGRSVVHFGLGDFWVADSRGSRWVLVAVIGFLVFVYASKLIGGRVGLGLHAIRDGDLFASAVGVNVRRYKAQAFFVSSMYAGLSGALIGLVFGVLVPEPFGFVLALDIILISILGGATFVVSGAIVGSAIFVLLPEVLDRYAGALPFVSEQLGAGGLGPTEVSRYLFGAAVVVIVIGEPEGIVALWHRARRRLRQGPSQWRRPTPATRQGRLSRGWNEEKGEKGWSAIREGDEGVPDPTTGPGRRSPAMHDERSLAPERIDGAKHQTSENIKKP